MQDHLQHHAQFQTPAGQHHAHDSLDHIASASLTFVADHDADAAKHLAVISIATQIWIFLSACTYRYKKNSEVNTNKLAPGDNLLLHIFCPFVHPSNEWDYQETNLLEGASADAIQAHPRGRALHVSAPISPLPNLCSCCFLSALLQAAAASIGGLLLRNRWSRDRVEACHGGAWRRPASASPTARRKGGGRDVLDQTEEGRAASASQVVQRNGRGGGDRVPRTKTKGV